MTLLIIMFVINWKRTLSKLAQGMYEWAGTIYLYSADVFCTESVAVGIQDSRLYRW